MDELQRLYEHQTMMAIGIYSFLDNLLANIPPRTENESSTAPEQIRPNDSSEISHLPIRTTISEFTTGLLGLTRMETFRERQERIRLTQTTGLTDTAPTSNEDMTDDSVPRSTIVRSNSNDSTELQPTKNEIIPGGYSETIFIYLSEREKEEYSCAVCYSILKEAYQCQNGHNFCYACIYTWSTGPTPGHDSCPVCRSDGLYAKNIDIMDRINRKHVRCPEVGCNWIGLLSAYGGHEHKHYTPMELDFLISDCKREKIIPILADLRTDTQVRQETSKSLTQEIKTTQLDEPSRDGTCSTNVGSSPEVCAPLTDSLNQADTVRGHNLVNLRGRERSVQNRTRQASRNPVQRRDRTTRSSSTSQNVPTPTRVRNTPTILNNTRRASQNLVANPQSNRPVIVNRTSRLNTPTGQNQISRGIGLSRRLTNRQTVPINNGVANGLQRVRPIHNDNEGLPSSNDTSTTELEPASDCTSGSLSMTESISLADGNEIIQSPASSGVQISNEISPTFSQTEQLSLPAIWASNALVNSSSQNPVEQENDGAPLRRQNQSPLEESNRMVNRPLEFRRLVPRRPGRVVEQLRETREQLAAMLRLMTTELEERRQHVLNVTLETASRGRLLRNFHMQRVQNLQREDDEVNGDFRITGSEGPDQTDTTQRIRFGYMRPQEHVNQADRAYYPDTTRTYHQGSSTQSLLTPTLREQNSNTNDLTRTNHNIHDQDHSAVSSTARLLARLRLNSLGQTDGTTLLMSRNRNISSLLPDPIPQNSINTGWSSDEDQSDD